MTEAAIEEEEKKEEVVTSVFIPDIEDAVQEYVVKWQDRDERDNFIQKHDPDLVKDELRPIVFEEIRQQVDEEVQVMLQNLKVQASEFLSRDQNEPYFEHEKVVRGAAWAALFDSTVDRIAWCRT